VFAVRAKVIPGLNLLPYHENIYGSGGIADSVAVLIFSDIFLLSFFHRDIYMYSYVKEEVM
jgi:hypothetical protein